MSLYVASEFTQRIRIQPFLSSRPSLRRSCCPFLLLSSPVSFVGLAFSYKGPVALPSCYRHMGILSGRFRLLRVLWPVPPVIVLWVSCRVVLVYSGSCGPFILLWSPVPSVGFVFSYTGPVSRVYDGSSGPFHLVSSSGSSSGSSAWSALSMTGSVANFSWYRILDLFSGRTCLLRIFGFIFDGSCGPFLKLSCSRSFVRLALSSMGLVALSSCCRLLDLRSGRLFLNEFCGPFLLLSSVSSSDGTAGSWAGPVARTVSGCFGPFLLF